MNRPPFIWDDYSDQPEIIRDKKLKKRLRLSALPAHLRSSLIGLVSLPIIFGTFLFTKNKIDNKPLSDFFGLCVNLDKEPDLTPDLIQELDVKKILIRIPIAHSDRIDTYIEFIKSLPEVDIHFNLLQDSGHAGNPTLAKEKFELFFERLSPFSHSFQIGNAVNRLKWGFISMEESLHFFATAQKVRDNKFPNLQLTGSSVIDFEPVSTTRSLLQKITKPYDRIAALLYVDRRGAPENNQSFIFNLRRKIRYIATIMKISGHGDKPLIISETNWPLVNTTPYSPAIGECCVTEESAANYLVRYYLEALSTGWVETIYWHQLIAPGYGLIDNRGDNLRKHAAFAAYKTLIEQTKGLIKTNYLKIEKNIYTMRFEGPKKNLTIVWALDNKSFPSSITASNYVNRDGLALTEKPKTAGPMPIYCIEPIT